MVVVWALLSLLGLLLVLAGWILFSALVIEIDSERNVYEIRQGGLYRLALFSDSEVPLLVKGRVLFVRFSFRIDKLGAKRRNKKKPRKKQQASSKNRRARAVKALWRALQLKYLHLVIDTGSAIWNAMLAPPARILNDWLPGQYSVRINFWGSSSIVGRLELRPANFIKHMFIQKPHKNPKS